MNRRHRATLAALFHDPVRTDVRWRHLLSLLEALGSEAHEGSGSRCWFVLHGRKLRLHRPHDGVLNRGQVRSVRLFLEEAGVEP